MRHPRIVVLACIAVVAGLLTASVPAGATVPTITTQPISQSVYLGQTATFTAAGTAIPTPTVEWQVSVDGGSTWIDTGLATTTISGVPIAFVNGWELRAVFTSDG